MEIKKLRKKNIAFPIAVAVLSVALIVVSCLLIAFAGKTGNLPGDSLSYISLPNGKQHGKLFETGDTESLTDIEVKADSFASMDVDGESINVAYANLCFSDVTTPFLVGAKIVSIEPQNANFAYIILEGQNFDSTKKLQTFLQYDGLAQHSGNIVYESSEGLDAILNVATGDYKAVVLILTDSQQDIKFDLDLTCYNSTNSDGQLILSTKTNSTTPQYLFKNSKPTQFEDVYLPSSSFDAENNATYVNINIKNVNSDATYQIDAVTTAPTSSQIIYYYVDGLNFASNEELTAFLSSEDSQSKMTSIGISTVFATINLKANVEYKGAILAVQNVDSGSTAVSTQMDITITSAVNFDKYNQSVPYDYAYSVSQQESSGTTSVGIKSLEKSNSIANYQLSANNKYDIKLFDDKVVTKKVPALQLMQAFENNDMEYIYSLHQGNYFVGTQFYFQAMFMEKTGKIEQLAQDNQDIVLTAHTSKATFGFYEIIIMMLQQPPFDEYYSVEFANTFYWAYYNYFLQTGILTPSDFGFETMPTGEQLYNFLLTLTSSKRTQLEDVLSSKNIEFNSMIYVPMEVCYYQIVDGTTYNFSSLPVAEISSNQNFDCVTIADESMLGTTDVSAMQTKQFKIANAQQFVEVDGAIFTADKTELLAYPCLSSASILTLTAETTNLMPNMFAKAKNLTEITASQTLFTKTQNEATLANSAIRHANIIVDSYFGYEDILQMKLVYNNLSLTLIDQTQNLKMTLDTSKGGYVITGVNDETQPKVFVGDLYGDVEVVGIESGAFAGNQNITDLRVPNTLKYFGDGAIEGCTNLKYLYLDEANLLEFGDNNLTDSLIVFASNSNTISLLKSKQDSVTAVKLNFVVDREQSSNTGAGGSGSGADEFAYTFTLSTTAETPKTYTYTFDYNYRSAFSNEMFDDTMLVFPSVAKGEALNSTLSAHFGVKNSDGYNIDHVQEQIALSKVVDGQTKKIYGTATDETYTNHNSYPVEVQYKTAYTTSTTDDQKVLAGDDLTLTINFAIMEYVQCFTGETLVTLADGSTKQIKDVTYDDLLLTYDFNAGKFAPSYPAWIASPGTYYHYYKMEFEDGSYVNIVLSHRLFTDDDLDFEKSIDATYSSVGKKFVRQVIDAQTGLPKLTTVTCTKITRIDEDITYYNMVTSQSLNFFANGYLGATGIANLYPVTKQNDQTYLYNQTLLNNTLAGTDDATTGTRYAYDRFDTTKIPYYIYVAYRLGETKCMANLLSQKYPDKFPPAVADQMAIATVNDYFGEKYMTEIMARPSTFKISFSDRSSNLRVDDQATYVLPTPQNSQNFVGWYNSFDGKTYQAGDSVTIYMNTHFVAVYSA